MHCNTLQYSPIVLGRLRWRMLGMQRHQRVVIEHSAASRVRRKCQGVVYGSQLGEGMEDHDFRVIEARAALAEARKRVPSDLGLEELREEITRFRKYVRWLIDLADDAADTEDGGP